MRGAIRKEKQRTLAMSKSSEHAGAGVLNAKRGSTVDSRLGLMLKLETEV